MPNEAALYIAINYCYGYATQLILASLVQTRKLKELRLNQAGFEIQFHRFYHCIKLSFMNAAILILAAATFYRNGMFEVAEIQDAHRFLEPLRKQIAPILFAGT
jgi:manganese transport protein